jgi:hypothetical protein
MRIHDFQRATGLVVDDRGYTPGHLDHEDRIYEVTAYGLRWVSYDEAMKRAGSARTFSDTENAVAIEPVLLTTLRDAQATGAARDGALVAFGRAHATYMSPAQAMRLAKATVSADSCFAVIWCYIQVAGPRISPNHARILANTVDAKRHDAVLEMFLRRRPDLDSAQRAALVAALHTAPQPRTSRHF